MPNDLPTRIDLRIADWGVYLNTRKGKLEIYRANRPELAHLVVQWGTTSGELDIHLTYGHEASRGPGDKQYESVCRIPHGALNSLGERAQPAIMDLAMGYFRKGYKKWRPGWLSRRGYVVTLIGEEEMWSWARVAVPKSRGKHRLCPELARDMSSFPESARQIYDPGVLHVEEVQRLGVPVCVQHPRDGVKAAVMLNYQRGPDGTLGWWGMRGRDMNGMAMRMNVRLFDWLTPRIRSEHAEGFERIVRGLALDELDYLYEGVAMTRRFLKEPRNPVRQPYPRARRAIGPPPE